MALYAKLSCGFPADPKVVMAGERAELTYIRAMLHCREHLTDGVIHRASLSRVCLGIGGKAETHAAKLVEVGLWLPHADGWQFPPSVWGAWNPTAAEVDEKRQAEADRKRDYRDRKRRDTGDRSSGVPDMSHWDTHGTLGQRDGQPEPEPEPEVLLASERESLADVLPIAPEPADAGKRRDELFEVVAEVCGIDTSKLTKHSRGGLNSAVKELRAQQATPGNVRFAARQYRNKFRGIELTPSALAKHWPALGSRRPNLEDSDGTEHLAW